MGFADELKKKESVSIVKKGNSFSNNDINPEYSENIPSSLSEIEYQISKLKNNIEKSAWHIGKRLIMVKDNYLNELGYHNISEYAKDKFGFSHTTTVRFIQLSTYFDKSSVLNFGSKLYLLSKLEDEQRQNYLEWIEKENPSYRDIEEKIKSEQPKKAGRPKERFSLTNTKLTVDFKKIGIKINKEKSQDFLKDLEELIKKYGN